MVEPESVADEVELLDPDDPNAVGYLERSLAGSPLWQMGPRASEDAIQRRDPRLLDFLASARDAPLGEMEFDVLAWMITRWFQVGRPADGRIAASFGDLGRSMFGRKGGGRQYALIRRALDNLYSVSIDLVVIEGVDEEQVFRRKTRRRIIHSLDIREGLGDGEGDSGVGSICVSLAPWLVDQLDTRTVTALSWGVMRKLTGLSKRLAVYLAAHTDDFSPITRHTERFTVELDDRLYEELGVTASRARQRRASVTRALDRILIHDARYSVLCVEPADGSHVLRAERRQGADVLALPTVG